ncbi:MAG: hypothetical protein HN509_14620 [Halobacteriovoraceae bacterium]|jgi:hypothetical protein|nr:hypothetical protein [Halobacteriovoraceae bacterium]MBT5094080.1 hypothetical protein [Halobacteriovoraceae bacterium]
MKARQLILLFLLLLIPALGQSQDWKNDDVDSKDLEALKNPWAKDIKDESLLKVRDADRGILFQDYNTQFDRYLVAAHGLINMDLQNAADMITAEATWSKKFDLAWIQLWGNRSTGKFREFGRVNSNLTTGTTFTNDEILEGNATVTGIGISIAYRTSYVRNLIKSDNLFETISVGIGRYNADVERIDKSFAGWGLKADFGIHRRTSQKIHYGLKMSYNLAELKHSQEFDTQTGSARSLLMTWIGLGFEFAFYF